MNRFFPNYPSHIITSPFGVRVHPVTGAKKSHNGIDLVATKDGKTGQRDYITAHTGGVVNSVGYSNSAGYYATIRVSSRSIMVYYHMAKMPDVKKGASVKKGDILGYMGSTGQSTGPHLHFGIQKDGKWIDPAPYLDKDYTEEVKTVKIEMEVLKYGAKGEQVKTLQRLLNAFGYKLDVDGSFGPATLEAVKAYQKAHGLAVDGSVGYATWTSLLGGS